MQRLVLVALLALVAVANAHHDLYIGHREPGDILIEQKKVDVDYKTLKVVEKTEMILGDGNYKITRIEAIDYKNKETSATPQILSGGIGQSFVTVKFTSTRGHGIHFILKAYGKRV